jgi:hypothetical protein
MIHPDAASIHDLHPDKKTQGHAWGMPATIGSRKSVT